MRGLSMFFFGLSVLLSLAGAGLFIGQSGDAGQAMPVDGLLSFLCLAAAGFSLLLGLILEGLE